MSLNVGIGVPSSPVLNIADTRQLDQSAARAMVKEVGGFSVPGSPMKWSTWNSMGTLIPSPALDEQGAALRAEFVGEDGDSR